MKKIFLLGIALSLTLSIYAQSDSIPAGGSSFSLDQVVISANKSAEKKSDIPNQITLISAQQIRQLSPQNTADVLQNSGAVFVQKSQQGGGSPVLRGFEANKVLLVVDGVRMNNAIFRAGHLQNVITVDPASLERIEVLYGAGSVIYGTDAIGGVISLYTQSPKISLSNRTETNLGGFLRYNSANQGSTAHAHFNVSGQKWANYFAITANDFGDLRSGKKDIKGYPNFGDQPYYVERVNGKDSVFQNSDPDLQKQSAYRQIDILEKLLYAPGGAFRHSVNLQYSNSTNVPRYDRLTELSGGKPKFAEWYYGPQQRLLASYQLQWDAKGKAADYLRLTPAFQQIQESRNDRRLNSANRNERVEDLQVASLNLDVFKNIARHEIRYGTELTHNKLDSEGTLHNIVTEAKTPLQSRYADGTLATYGVFASHRWEIAGPKLILSDGLRYSGVNMDIQFDPRFFEIADLRNVKQSSASFNYNIGLTSNLPGGFHAAAMLSSGFRNPNIDDAAKIFENASGTLTIPNPKLKPEQVLHREISLGQQIEQRFEVGTSLFYSSLTDAIATKAVTYKGQNFIIYGGDTLSPVQNVNVAKAKVLGISAYASLNFAQHFQLRGNVAYTEGRDETNDVPLDHIPPFLGNVLLRWNSGKWNAETDLLFNGWKHLEDYSPSGEDNLQYATAEGMPAWQVWNLRAGWQVAPKWRVQAAVENILDLNYRVFASGINGPGRNFVLGVYYGK